MANRTIAIDVGGTFVDLVLFEHDVATAFHKHLSESVRREEALLSGIEFLTRDGDINLADVGTVVYSTTLAVNAVIQRDGARTALVTTNGFRDVIEIGREQPYDLYNPFGPFQRPLVPRDLRFTVDERVRADGMILRSPDPDEVEGVIDDLEAAEVDSVGVCFLHSFVNPEMEEYVGGRISARLPHAHVSLSSHVHPEVGEYGRFSTTAVNAYVSPLMNRHLSRLDSLLRMAGFSGRLLVATSAQGMMTWKSAAKLPVKLLESGPAAGSAGVAGMMDARWPNWSGEAVSFDMGGTTAKASLIRNHSPLFTTDYEIDRVERFKRGSGLLVTMPTVDIVEVGAGGGSIAYVDPAGLLAVGPRSAGADPGPCSYGRGGYQPTVTDADLLLGYLNPSYFLGGRMTLDVELARVAMEAYLADPLSLTVEEAAMGVFRVVNSNMMQAVAVHASERGVNLRRSILVAVGGAGPTHACELARQLKIPEIVVPLRAGVFSAVGCKVIPAAFDHATSYQSQLGDIDVSRVRGLFTEMENRCLAGLEGAVSRAALQFIYSVDLRYAGQRTTLTVQLEQGDVNRALLEQLAEAFENEYEKIYGRRIYDVPLEVVTWRLRAEEVASSGWPRLVADKQMHGTCHQGERLAFFPGHGFVTTTVMHQDELPPGEIQVGPAVLEGAESNLVVAPGWGCEYREGLGFIMRMEER